MYFDARPSIKFNYFKSLRFVKLKEFSPKELFIISRDFKVKVNLEDIAASEDSYIQYRFTLKDGMLKEVLLIQESSTCFELLTPCTEEEGMLFLRYMLPLFGVAHYGFLPGSNQPSGLTMRIVSTFLKESDEIHFKYGDIVENETDTSGLSLYTSDGGFYAVSYSFTKNMKIKDDEQIEEFMTVKKAWGNVIETIEDVMKKNRLKVMFVQ